MQSNNTNKKALDITKFYNSLKKGTKTSFCDTQMTIHTTKLRLMSFCLAWS